MGFGFHFIWSFSVFFWVLKCIRSQSRGLGNFSAENKVFWYIFGWLEENRFLEIVDCHVDSTLDIMSCAACGEF